MTGTNFLGTKHWLQKWCLHIYLHSLLSSEKSSSSTIIKTSDHLLDELLCWYTKHCGDEVSVYCLQSCMTLLSKLCMDCRDFKRGRSWYLRSLPSGRFL